MLGLNLVRLLEFLYQDRLTRDAIHNCEEASLVFPHNILFGKKKFLVEDEVSFFNLNKHD